MRAKDYDCSRKVDGVTPYAVWKSLEDTGQDLRPGDLLEIVNPDEMTGALYIAKYIGFEPAEWYVPEVRPETPATPFEFTPAPLTAPASERRS